MQLMQPSLLGQKKFQNSYCCIGANTTIAPPAGRIPHQSPVLVRLIVRADEDHQIVASLRACVDACVDTCVDAWTRTITAARTAPQAARRMRQARRPYPWAARRMRQARLPYPKHLKAGT
eukprot:351127-Chlamydomonas_euryale.AAC.7